MPSKYPKGIELICKRDWTLLNSILVVTNQVVSVKKYLGRGFSFASIAVLEDACFMYFDEKDKFDFIDFSAAKLNVPGYVDMICSKLHKFTDEFRELMSDDSITAERAKDFLTLHAEHHAYHIAVLWAGDYAESHRAGTGAMREKLFEARAYNERTLPAIDTWLRKQRDPVQLLTPEEFLQYGSDRSLPEQGTLDRRRDYTYFYINNNERSFLSGAEAEQEHARTRELASHNEIPKQKVVSGVGVSKGMASGVARVVQDFEDFKKIQKGEILVTAITLPKYNDWISNAAGIVTDEGGMLNHAAIVSREFGIPCVSGTEIATKIFSTGDHIEVDANAGVARMVE